MPFVSCPNCRSSITQAEALAGHCPRCGSRVADVPAPGRARDGGQVVAAELVADSPRQDLMRWCTVRTALSLVAAGTILLLVSALMALLLLLAAPGNRANPGLPALARLFSVTILVGGSLYLVGLMMCGVV